MASTPTKNKRFTTRFDAGPLFVPGGAPTAHEVLSEGGIFRRNRIGPHSDNPRLSGVGLVVGHSYHCVQAMVPTSNANFAIGEEMLGRLRQPPM